MLFFTPQKRSAKSSWGEMDGLHKKLFDYCKNNNISMCKINGSLISVFFEAKIIAWL